jgi:ribosomal protein L3 glutamine methyltransferase
MDPAPQQSLTLDQCIDQIAQRLEAADLHYGHGAMKLCGLPANS